jgi:beta-glucosidase
MRLLGFERILLQPSESRNITMTADPRLLARYDEDSGQWQIVTGTYHIGLGKAADNLVLTAETSLTGSLFDK